MHILVTGGTGFIGSLLVRRLTEEGNETRVLSRGGKAASTERISLDSEGLIPTADLARTAGIVNLAGESINQRWTASARQRILDSRLSTTRLLARSCVRNWALGLPVPEVLVNASATGFYGPRPVGPQTEESPGGEGFLADVCREWEQAALEHRNAGLRVAILRFGVVFGPGGALSEMARPYRFGLGGYVGSGMQLMSWIHREDLVRIIMAALRTPSMQGIYNATAPNPVSAASLCQELAGVLGTSCRLRIPAGMARFLFGDMADEILMADQTVFPGRLQQAGHAYLYANLAEALAEIGPSLR